MIPLSYGLSISIVLFIIGCIGILIRRNFLFVLLGLEIMINSAALAFVIVGSCIQQVDGQIMYILIITFAASESAISLAFLLRLYRNYHTFYIDKLDELHE